MWFSYSFYGDFIELKYLFTNRTLNFRGRILKCLRSVLCAVAEAVLPGERVKLWSSLSLFLKKDSVGIAIGETFIWINYDEFKILGQAAAQAVTTGRAISIVMDRANFEISRLDLQTYRFAFRGTPLVFGSTRIPEKALQDMAAISSLDRTNQNSSY